MPKTILLNEDKDQSTTSASPMKTEANDKADLPHEDMISPSS